MPPCTGVTTPLAALPTPPGLTLFSPFLSGASVSTFGDPSMLTGLRMSESQLWVKGISLPQGPEQDVGI